MEQRLLDDLFEDKRLSQQIDDENHQRGPYRTPHTHNVHHTCLELQLDCLESFVLASQSLSEVFRQPDGWYSKYCLWRLNSRWWQKADKVWKPFALELWVVGPVSFTFCHRVKQKKNASQDKIQKHEYTLYYEPWTFQIWTSNKNKLPTSGTSLLVLRV